MEQIKHQVNTAEGKNNLGLDTFSRIFRLAMTVKIFYGIIKIAFALALWKWATIVDPAGLFYQLTAKEIIEDSNDLFVRVVSPLIKHLSVDSTTFAVFYLLFWGIVDDIFLSINILRDRLWAFPFALSLITLFVIYEMYRVLHTHSLILVGIIIIDVGIFYLIAKEYNKVIKRQTKTPID